MTKNIIFHIDDIGTSISANKAAFELLRNGYASSGSIMVPCKGFDNAINQYKLTPQIDLGIHLTLTSERDQPYDKWGPTLSPHEVPSLIDQSGFFYKTLNEVFNNATYEDIKKEVCNQIEIALRTNLSFSHYDAHMGVFLHKKLFYLYKEIAEIFKIQPFITYPQSGDSLGNRFFNCNDEICLLEQQGYKIIDQYDANSLYEGKNNIGHFLSRLNNVRNGTTYFLLHALPNNIEREDMTPDMSIRINEYNILKSQQIQSLIKKNNINSISMKDFISSYISNEDNMYGK